MRGRALRLALAIGVIATPACALPQAVVGVMFMVKNNSAAKLRCRYRVDEGMWGEYFRLNPGAEFDLRRQSSMEVVYFFCDPPVKRVSYRLEAGKRHSILPGEGGALELREVTPG